MNRRLALAIAAVCFGLLLIGGLAAPEHLPVGSLEIKYQGPLEAPPFGTDARGRPLLAYALQGASVILLPAVVAGGVVSLFAVLGGLLRCVGGDRADALLQAFSEVVGALPRMVVILVIAMLLPSEWRGLLPLAVAWAVLSAPGAMDEAAAVAERLGGARFVEALRAHGFSWTRIYLYHLVVLNLRPVVVRQAAETTMQVTFLELALSYLAIQEDQSSFTHSDNVHSWADLLQMGYRRLVVPDEESGHALMLGILLIGMILLMSRMFTAAARAR